MDRNSLWQSLIFEPVLDHCNQVIMARDAATGLKLQGEVEPKFTIFDSTTPDDVNEGIKG